MSFFWSRSCEAPCPPASELWPDTTGRDAARRADLAFRLYEVGRAPPRKASRATLPDVDVALAVRQPRRPLLERLFGASRAVKNHHRPSPRAV